MKNILNIIYKQMVSLQNEFSYESSDFQLQNKNKMILYIQMASLQNEFSYESSYFQLQNKNKIIPYIQMASLQNELSYESSDFQLQNKKPSPFSHTRDIWHLLVNWEVFSFHSYLFSSKLNRDNGTCVR